MVADKDAIPVIVPELLNTRAFELTAEPAVAPERNADSEPISYPAIEIVDNPPILVMFG